MYSVKLGYDEAIRSIRSLIDHNHHAEALVTSVFTIEKTLKRVLRALVLSAGFPSVQATTLMDKFDGLNKIKEVWHCFDPLHQKLSEFLPPQTLQAIAETQKMRNKLVHGAKVFQMDLCKQETERALLALDTIRNTFEARYGFDGWSPMKPRKKSALHSDPKVKPPITANKKLSVQLFRDSSLHDPADNQVTA